MSFSELLGRSSFSFLIGASGPEEMVGTASEQGVTSFGLCDRDGLYGCVRAHLQAKESRLPLHVGCEMSLARVGTPVHRVEQPKPPQGKPPLDAPVAAFLVQNHHGYTNLCRLLTLAHRGLPKGQSLLERRFLDGSCEGLCAVVPVQLGSAGRCVQSWLEPLAEQFSGRGYIAMYRRLDGRDTARQQLAEEWSLHTGFSVIASARPLFHKKERKPLADIVHCIRSGITLEQAGQALLANAEAFLHTEAQMLRLFSDHPEWVARTGEVAAGLSFTLDELQYQFPCTLEPGETADERLHRLTWEGARRRYPNGVPTSVSTQLQKELQLIAQLKVAPYFLCTFEVVEIARSLKILCQGRGSAANSAVCYVLGITAVDPSRSSLLFERFLSAERNEPPDIDIDFEHERREEVIQEIYRRYGRERAAMVSEVIRYRGKSALREVGKVFGLSPDQVEHLSQGISHWDSAEAIQERLAEYGFDSGDQRVRQVLHWAKELQGAPRHLSVHVGGFVLSKSPLFEVTPVEPATMPGRTVVPWDKDDIEALGFFKVDVLALGMLTAIRKAVESIHQGGELVRRGAGKELEHSEDFDPLEAVARIPAEDPAVYAMISEADTVGIFQIESRAQMAMLPRLRPQHFYDLVIEVAIVRPGPIQGGMVHPYLRRRNQEEAAKVPHPDLWPILERTLGIPLFQEQVMQISIVGAGYSGGQADQLRRDMAAWKKSGKLLRHRERLLSGFEKKGIPRQFGEALFEQIKGFGDYGFPESHAASFALLVYLSSWIKIHFPAHFTCALLNSQPMGFYSASSLVRDAKAHGVEVKEVNVMHSAWDCTLEPASSSSRLCSRYPSAQRALRLGFRQVKGLGQKAGERIETARRAAGFTSLEDLMLRARLKKDEVEALAEAGALEEIIAGRRQALWATRAPRGFGLFRGVELESRAETILLPEMNDQEQLIMDYDRVGLSIHDHPLCHLRPQLVRRGVIRAEQLPHMAHQSPVCVAGVVLTRQRPLTASGVVFFTLEDETGTVNLVLFSKVFEKYRLAARHATLLLVRGKLERQLTLPRTGEVGKATPVIHVIGRYVERLDVPGRSLVVRSRDFH